MPRLRPSSAALFVLVPLLAACSSTLPSSAGLVGAEIRPASRAAYNERGLASWYGERYHGRTTANGERFNMNAMTAAHRSLPFGTRVEVTNLLNGRSVVVRINDRGPFIAGRIIDLSRRGAERLGFLNKGLADVRVVAIGSS